MFSKTSEHCNSEPSVNTNNEKTGLDRKPELPRKYKILILVLVCMMSFGANFSGVSFGYLKSRIISKLNISNTKYGVLQSSSKLMNTIMPFVAGLYFDASGSAWGVLAVSIIILLGTSMVAISSSINSYGMMVAGRLIYGIGSGAIVSIQQAILAQCFAGGSVSVAIGIQLSTFRLSSFLGTVSVVPFANLTGSITYSFALASGFCALSALLSLVYCLIVKTEKIAQDLPTIKRKGRFKWKKLLYFPAIFWLIMLSQTFLGALWTSFLGFNADLIKVKFNSSDATAAYIASVSQIVPILCPFILGFAMDYFGKRMCFYIGSAILLVISFSLLNYTYIHPLLSMVIFSFSLAIGPIANITALSLILPVDYISTALGLKRSLASIVTALLDLFSGYIQDRTAGKNYDRVLLMFIVLSGLTVVIIAFNISYDRMKLGGILDASKKRRLEHMNEMENGNTNTMHTGYTQNLKKTKKINIISIVVSLIALVLSWVLFIFLNF
ncbi:Major facilitator superfamily domain-containing protein 1 [Smittium culicis]|uniref:Lysosomal dipeptide transporter MFSD1 n=1 Tax=Smittium culicis TaxID=133412 RepID=A0A1R1XZD2_9FUNG|nr:Major facilitator superfamily domain-containing protein 1 [Smittium culicis]